MSDPTKVAEWLVIGFVKHWRMGQITSALGVDLEDDAAMVEFSNAYPFLPSSKWQYRAPVRAFVASQWPKLGEWLLKHESNPVSCLAVVPKIVGLKCSQTNKSTFIDKKDLADGERTRLAMKITKASNAARRTQRLSSQRGAWNVCK